MDKPVYLDHHATTPVDPRVAELCAYYFLDCCGNAASSHLYGKAANESLMKARSVLGSIVNAPPESVIITSGATEANNIALMGTKLPEGRNGLCTTNIEHSSVLEVAKHEMKNGRLVRLVPCGKNGIVDPDMIRRATEDGKIGMVSVMYANNEIGTIQPIKEISKICKERGILLHVDCCQTFAKLPISINDVDLISASAHKVYGPKGVGALIAKPGLSIKPIMYGGTQEMSIRPGTVNVPGACGFAYASKLSNENWHEESLRLAYLRNLLLDRLMDGLGNNIVHVNGSMNHRLPHNLNITLMDVCPQTLRPVIDPFMSVSGASACRNASSGSHVLEAIGAPDNDKGCPIRFGLGKDNTEADIEYVADIICREARKLHGKGCAINN
jgi:cysteine desulfurase